jgi:hypothetical protein
MGTREGRRCSPGDPGVPRRLAIVVVSNNLTDNPLAGPGPLCPGCGEPLRENLQTERLDAEGPSRESAPTKVSVVFCRSCGLSLHVEVASPVRTPLSDRIPVAKPADPNTLDGRFQLRCQDLITQIREMGFEPHVWVDTINELGGLGAAKQLLATKRPLVATPWLVSRDRADLTLEHEIMEVSWSHLFDDDERAEAARRLRIARE